ncbi:MAG: mannose-1-phosphate guanylyltransferase/mannose-6-phosphate isomerase, partial [Pseudomonadota bacterium]
GGAGTRLWPLSRDARPKQLQPILSDRSMLQETLLRASGEPSFAAPLIVANAAHVEEIFQQANEVRIPPAALAVEPAGRNTAPAVMTAALLARQLGYADEDLLLVLPADHFVPDGAAFRAAVRAAAPSAAAGALVTFGVAPSAPETGYGYILRGEARGPAFAVERFVEKPDAATAREFLADGRYYWNAGMFLFRIDAVLEAGRSHCPDILASAEQSLAQGGRDGDVFRLAAEPFEACRSDSIDYAVMEKADNVMMAPAAFGWSDIGSWTALAELSDADADGNVLLGDVIALDSTGCYIRIDQGLAGVVGLQDIILVRTDDVIMAAPKARAQEVKRLVSALQERLQGAKQTGASP